MRFILLSLLCSIFSSSVFAQNWSLFPYDSVYFINPNNHKDELIPIVKSSDPDLILSHMAIYEEAIMNLPNNFQELDIIDYPEPHRFGQNMNVVDGIFSFRSAYVTGEIKIDLEASLNEVDTQTLFYNNGEIHYLKTYVDSIYFDSVLNDTLKSIQFTLLDDQYSEEIFTDDVEGRFVNFNCVGSIFQTTVTTENIRILIGKTTGIREIPSLATYPRSKMYIYYKTVEEIKDLLSQPVLQPGDEFEEFYYYEANYTPPVLEKYKSKTKITSLNIDLVSKTLNYIVEYWKEDISNPANPVFTYEPNKMLSYNYEFDNYIFNGINENKNNISYFLRLDSKWGHPVLDPYGWGINNPHNWAIGKHCLLHNITELNTYWHYAPQTSYQKCILYSNIDGIEYGTSNNVSSEEIESLKLQVTGVGGILRFNKGVSGVVTLYSIDGQQVFNQYVTSSTQWIPLPDLAEGVYILKLETLNEVVKVHVSF